MKAKKLNTKYIALLILFVLTFGVVSQVLLQMWVDGKNVGYAIGAYIFQIALITAYSRILLQRENLGIANAFWSAGSTVVVFLISLFVFHQESDAYAYAGVSAVALGIGIMGFSRSHSSLAPIA